MKRAPQLFPIPAGTSPTTCRSCGQRMYWITTASGAAMPTAVEKTIGGDLLTGAYEPVGFLEGRGYCHRIDCPTSDQHPRSTRRKVAK